MRIEWPIRSIIVICSCFFAWTPHALALSSETLLTARGPFNNEKFGRSAAACDLNGDGATDWIVSAPEAATVSGRVYVYYGGDGADAIADLTITGTGAEELGWSLASAGDVNGDGFQDLIVGAPDSDAAGTNNGRAYLFFGGPGFDAVADLVVTGTSAGGQLGYSVAGAGDVNGDGFGDLIVGAPTAFSNAGRAYIILGGSSPDALPDLTLNQAALELFGEAVSGAGDLNGDGYADFAVGAPSDELPTSNGGFAVYLGAGDLSQVESKTVQGSIANDRLGSSLAAVGDVNQDGFGDLLVAANNITPGSSNIAKAYLYLGGSFDLVPDRIFTDPSGASFANAVAAAGDVDRDGFSDFLISSYAGVYLYLGSKNLSTSPSLTLVGENEGLFGTSITASGDVNGDGFGDVLVGSESPFFVDHGVAYVISIYPFQVLTPNGEDVWIAGSSATVGWRGHDQADVAVSFDAGVNWSTVASGVGGEKVNWLSLAVPPTETQYAMIRVSATGAPPQRSNSDASDARFRIILPKRAPAAAASVAWLASGAFPGDQLGTAASPAGDVNGDGYADVIVGAPLNDFAGADAGRAYLYLGGPGSDAGPDLVLTGASAGDSFGWAVGTAGDMNGDGYGDVAVGAPGNDATGADAGRVYVYFGGAALNATADLLLAGGGPSAQFGYSIASLRDVNADGYDDIAVGAPLADAGETDAGQALVFYGGSAPSTGAALTISGTNFSDQLGTSIAAGDVNGDGHSDLVIGIPFRDHEAGIDAGSVRVLYGGPSIDAAADMILTGEAGSGYFGYSVSAGDSDGDGRANVLVGAPGMNTATGAAYLFCRFGETGAAGACRYDGEESGDFFGYSVVMGDWNGDGYADPLVGAPYNDAAGVDAGKAYFFYGVPGGDAIVDHAFVGTSGSRFGLSVAAAGNVLGNGVGTDAVVGAPLAGNGALYLYDFSRYRISAPNGGETWQVGAMKEVRWSGAEVANVWLSVDGGQNYQLLRGAVGGKADNTLALRVPHTPSKFARVRITPVDVTVSGLDETDSLFSIQTSVALLALLAAPAPGGAHGAVVSWATEPGPADLAGYRLERGRASGMSGATGPSGSGWVTVVSHTRESSFMDSDAAPGSMYRLYAVNGLGEELLVGETVFAPRAPLAAWPLPYRGGTLAISYAAGAGFGGAVSSTEVALFDIHGRLVRKIASGPAPVGYHAAVWDGLDDRGSRVAAGVYFIRVQSAGEEQTMKVAVVR